MKKILITVILVLTVALIFGIAACASGITDGENGAYAADAVVAINGVGLTAEQALAGELQLAVDDCIAGGTIEVLADFGLPSLSLGANADGDAAKWVINGNGYTVTDSDNTQRDGSSHTDFLVEITDSIAVINDLTLKTFASGIRANETYANITLNNVNVYAGGTLPGTEVTEMPDTSASTLKRYAFALYFRGSANKHYDEFLDNISVSINGGEYKTVGADGTCMYIRGASVVVNDGTFVGEDTTFVAWVYNASTTTDISSVSASLSVHNGLFIRPVSGGAAVGSNNPDAAVGGVIRVTHGALFNAYGGTFVNCDGTAVAEGETAPNSCVVFCGTASSAGLVNIYGGEFYQLSPVGSTSGEIIGHSTGTTATLEDPATMLDLTRATILGGKFYVREGLPDSNMDAIVAAKANAEITENDGSTVQRAAWSDFAVVRGTDKVARTVYGVEYADLYETEFSYTGEQGSNKLRIVTAEGRTYYTSDMNMALNSMAGNGSTVYLIAKISTSSKIKVLARNISLNIYGVGSTYEWDFTANTTPWQGFWFRAGDISFDGKIKLKTTSAGTALYLGLPDDSVLRPISLTVTLGDVRFRREAELVYKNVGVAEGSFKATNCLVDDTGTSTAGYELSYKHSESYSCPVPKPKFTVKTNLTLYSDLIVNFYIPVEGNTVETFTIGGVTHNVAEAPTLDIEGVQHYKLSHTRLSPADAMCKIPYGCTYSSENGYFTYSASSSYSIVKYATNIQNKDTHASSKALVAAVVAYMNAAHEYFGSSVATDEEVAAMTEFLAAYPVSMPEDISDPYGADASAISSVASAVTFDLGDSSIRLLLRIADGTKPISVSVGGQVALSLAAGHGKDILSVNLRAYDLTKLITISSGDLTGTYSFARYYEDATALDSSESLKSILLAMYTYGSSALSYRNYLESGSSAVYSIVYPEGDAHAQEMAELAQRYILATCGVSYAVVSDAAAESEYEILIGATSRAASAVDCPAGSFHISLTGGKVVAYGDDDFYLDMAVLYMLENLVSADAADGIYSVADGYSLTKEQEYALSGYAQFGGIVSDTMTYETIKKYSESELYKNGVDGYEYGYTVSDLVATVGGDVADAAISSIDTLAYGDLGKYVTLSVNGGTSLILRFEKQLSTTAGSTVESLGRFVGTYTGTDGSYAYTLVMQDGLATLVGEHFSYAFSYAPDGSSVAKNTGAMKNAQGAATDGTYVYMYVTNSNRKGAVGTDSANYGVVWKIDPASGAVVKKGSVISAGHGNDICYDPVSGMLLLAWGGLDNSLVSVIDPETLDVVEVVDFGGSDVYDEEGNWVSGYGFYGFAYSEEKGLYIGATSSANASDTGSALWALTRGGEGAAVLDHVIVLPTLSYTKQGIDCDGTYIYHSFSTGSGASSRAYVRVFDWDGNLVRTFTVPYPDSGTNTIEIESIMWIDGRYYASFNRGGTAAIVELAINYNY